MCFVHDIRDRINIATDADRLHLERLRAGDTTPHRPRANNQPFDPRAILRAMRSEIIPRQ